MNRNENEAESFAGNFVVCGEYGLFFEVPLWIWTAFPPRASVGHKPYTAAWSQILRPTSKCGPSGFRWPRPGQNWLKRWGGYSPIKEPSANQVAPGNVSVAMPPPGQRYIGGAPERGPSNR